MTKTKTTHNPWEMHISSDMLDAMYAKITELGGNPEIKEFLEDTSKIEISYIREWPTHESAQTWCDYILTLPDTGIKTAEVFED